METKLLSLKATISDGSPGTLEGLGAATGNVDRGGDVIEPGAYSNLGQFIKDGHLLVGHEWGELGIATFDDANEVPEGLQFKATFHTDPEAQATRTRVKERMDRGKSVGLSIGYKTLEAKDGQVDGQYVRFLTKIEVYEISLVPAPMNPKAVATGAKSFSDEYDSALAAVQTLIRRAKALQALRDTEGRKLSETHRNRFEALAAEMEGLHSQLKTLLVAPPTAVTDEELSRMQSAIEANRKALSGL